MCDSGLIISTRRMPLNWTTTMFYFPQSFARYVYMYRKAKSILALALCVIFGYYYPLLTKIVEMLPLRRNRHLFAYEFRGFTAYLVVWSLKNIISHLNESCNFDIHPWTCSHVHLVEKLLVSVKVCLRLLSIFPHHGAKLCFDGCVVIWVN